MLRRLGVRIKEVQFYLSNSPCKKEATTRQGVQEGANFCTTLLLFYHTSDWPISKTYQNLRWLHIHLSLIDQVFSFQQNLL